MSSRGGAILLPLMMIGSLFPRGGVAARGSTLFFAPTPPLSAGHALRGLKHPPLPMSAAVPRRPPPSSSRVSAIASSARRGFHAAGAPGRARSLGGQGVAAGLLAGGLGAGAWWLGRTGATGLHTAHSEQAETHTIGHTNILPGGLVTHEHMFKVPLDHSDPSKGTIEIFARELVSAQHAAAMKSGSPPPPTFLFLQGGPGFPAGRPHSPNGGWIQRALQDYRVLLLDQRGTGRSTPVTHETLAREKDPERQAEMLSYLRADSIVKDCELIREAFIGKKEKWTVLGQSFGGFCVCSYLSFAPEGLAAALLTGGLPPIDNGCTADKVYDATYERMAVRTQRFYERYPQHVDTVRDIVKHLEENPTPLPGGGVLTARRFLQLGLALGSGSGFEHMHYLLERPWKEGGGGLSYEFLVRVEGESSFETNPLYAVMHESIYCSGSQEGSRWSAGRRIDPRFDYKKTLAEPNGQIMMFGEHTFDWMYDDYASLRGLKEAAEVIARKKDWGKLYDAEAMKLCSVPSAAAVYYDDVYVEHDLSVKTAALTGSGKGGTKMKIWVTNEYQHSGLRDDGYRILDRLLGMVRGTQQVPS